MREHEVPTHVQAEDRVLLWFTFPQIVAITAVSALSYGAYSYAPGPSEMRMALAAVIGLAGIAMVVGKIGGRRLPLVAADLLKYRLVARLYVGSPAQLVRNEPPAPVESGPGPLSLMARRVGRGPRRVRVIAKRGLRRLRRNRRRRDGRTPFRPHGWFGKRRETRTGENVNGRRAASHDGKKKPRRRGRGRFLSALLGASALALLLVAVPVTAVADGHGPEGGWTSPEIEFQPPEPVPGRRIFVERLHVSGDSAAVTLRAATGLDLRVRAFGGQSGLALRFWGSARLDEGELIHYSLPLNGPAPSFTFSWEDELGQAGAVTGVIDSECVAAIEEMVELPTSAGHHEETVTAVMLAEVVEIAGTLTVAGRGSATSVPFVPDGETPFSLPVATVEAIHSVTIDASLEATLSIPLPPLTQLTHHPERTEYRTETVRLVRPGTTRTVSETVSVTHDDGTTTQHVVSVVLSIPSAVIHRDVTLTIVHPERVVAEVVEREPVDRAREESLSMASSVGSDAPFEVLVLPEPEPVEPPAEQSPGGDGLRDWFDFLGWEWPW